MNKEKAVHLTRKLGTFSLVLLASSVNVLMALHNQQTGGLESHHARSYDHTAAPCLKARNKAPPYKFAFITATGSRPNGAFYFNKALRALAEVGVPADSILVNNYAGKNNTILFSHFANTNYSYVPRMISRPPQLLHPPIRFKVAELSHKKAKTAAGDNAQRKFWRIRQAQDFLYVMKEGLATFQDTDWFIFFEDDAECNQNSEMLSLLSNYTARQPPVPFTRLNRRGMVAQLFHRMLMEGFVAYAASRYDLVPIDWLLSLYLDHMGISAEKFDPSMGFCLHKGKQSSFFENEKRVVDQSLQ